MRQFFKKSLMIGCFAYLGSSALVSGVVVVLEGYETTATSSTASPTMISATGAPSSREINSNNGTVRGSVSATGADFDVSFFGAEMENVLYSMNGVASATVSKTGGGGGTGAASILEQITFSLGVNETVEAELSMAFGLVGGVAGSIEYSLIGPSGVLTSGSYSATGSDVFSLPVLAEQGSYTLTVAVLMDNQSVNANQDLSVSLSSLSLSLESTTVPEISVSFLAGLTGICFLLSRTRRASGSY